MNTGATKAAVVLVLSLISVACKQVDRNDHFDVYFIVLVTEGDAAEAVTEERLRDEITILNQYFRAESGAALPGFRYAGASFGSTIADTSCPELLAMGEIASPYEGSRWNQLINHCDDSRLANRRAINFYVNDSWSEERGFADADSHGRNNDNWPYVIIDWRRLGHKLQSPEEHEMGHAFGLTHVCVDGATRGSDTNIMASSGCGKGSGGRRNVGFDEQQVEVIWRSASLINAKLNQQARGL